MLLQVLDPFDRSAIELFADMLALLHVPPEDLREHVGQSKVGLVRYWLFAHSDLLGMALTRSANPYTRVQKLPRFFVGNQATWFWSRICEPQHRL